MNARYTDRVRNVLRTADRQAQRFNHEYLGTEHLLLGLADERGCTAEVLLDHLSVDRDEMRRQVEATIYGRQEAVVTHERSLSPLASKVLEYSADEARRLNHNYVGTEHLLLGLLREQECVPARVLAQMGVELDVVRDGVLRLVGRGI